MLKKVKSYLQDLQNRICHFIETEDGKATFLEEKWQHENGAGGGMTRVIADGNVIEKGGVNFSHVTGLELPQAATLKRPALANSSFQAMGVSVVMHPQNPFVPTSHMNVRLIYVEKPGQDPIWWFGGGFDMTPYYGFDEDCIHWHRTAKAACDPFGEDVYPKLKKWCDDYFFLKNRNEPRGIGGIFSDDVNEWGFDRSFEFMKSVGDHYIKAYQGVVA